MKADNLAIRSRLGDYPVRFYTDFGFLSELAALPNPVIIVDQRVLELYGDTLRTAFGDSKMYVLEVAEENKNLDEVGRIYQWVLTNYNAKRNINLISIGGGITQDVTGFVASTLFRGVGWNFVPTTLLAQVDSCIGGKTSLNFGNRKNLLGTFYPPQGVHIAPVFTHTLSQLDLYSGYGEVAKFLLMRKFESGEPLDTTAAELNSIIAGGGGSVSVIRSCLDVKRSFMEDDEFDRGRRNLLNYGHCFGHALESASGYYVPHGIAVNIGIIFANLVAARRNLLPKESVEAIMREINLPLLVQRQRKDDYSEERLLENLKNDKKRIGDALPLVVPVAGGLVKLDDFSEAEFRHTLSELLSFILLTDE